MFSKSSSLKSGFASLLFTVCAFLPAAAQADESQDQLVAQMLSVSPYACLADANVMLSEQLARLLPGAVLSGMGNHMPKTMKWAPGEKTYDEVFAIVRAALDLELAKNGPVLEVPIQKIFDMTVRKWTPEERRYFSAFFATRGGKLYLSDIVDGAICAGWLMGLNQPPYQPFTGAAKTRWESLLQSKSELKAQVADKLATLSPQERKEFDTAGLKLTDALTEALKDISTEGMDIQRFSVALEPSLPAISRALRKAQ